MKRGWRDAIAGLDDPTRKCPCGRPAQTQWWIRILSSGDEPGDERTCFCTRRCMLLTLKAVRTAVRIFDIPGRSEK